MENRELVLNDIHSSMIMADLFKAGVVKFGEFTLKSGVTSPIYIDLRVAISQPELLTNIADAVGREIRRAGVEYDRLCGVPYTALPIAAVLSSRSNRSMIFRRKEAKSYGTKKLIDGEYQQGDRIVIVEDVVTSGSSILETVKLLEDVGLKATEAFTVIDREQGGKEFLKEHGVNLHSIFTLSSIITQLETEGKIASNTAKKARDFIANVRPDLTADAKTLVKPRISFEERAKSARHPVAKRLFEIISAKKTNLCVALDVTTTDKLLQLAEQLGPYVCALKTHIDLIDDFDYRQVIPRLQELARKNNFLLFEDRKFGDIGETVQRQYSKGIYRISEWADLVTVHGIPGPGVIQGLANCVKPYTERACIVVAEMSSNGTLTTEAYKKSSVDIIEKHSDFAIGAVSQSRLSESSSFVHMTPGVKINGGGDTLGQQYVTPQIAIGERGADVIIVGRGITEAPNPADVAVLYATQAWKAYEVLSA
ncbi:uridine 5'-monophosphate synthase-like isoform X2 [Varroa jacobsoni]|uniref:uridine 5'-monophosphate synthase-like isoform X2 n=1 Tax=Varroa jacobsoni TaxID=62625 RepID=UPI000BF92093|nr:uridine 5'-monophosphate synthase-like isoform X2 [Varroa jacobsoni]XP_022692120.1 uridine 5'-monophosphate synthase-like isoform X2 [Varroa jacobsoni]XP_022692121.1 uridine 5'-monophosphate synthase-like isoform X2 [Varroa jacobsoni]XP_022692122.1 uridine 5'-monophosphate synthase-like isoform X2 [Varroa jacobsoni]